MYYELTREHSFSRERNHMRVGFGHDTHRVAPGGPITLGGITIDSEIHLVGHSDADVILPAITDAILGASALGDIGELFPNTSIENENRDSAEMLTIAAASVRKAGFEIVNLDCVVSAEDPNISKHRSAIRMRISEILNIDVEQVFVKGKTGESVGAVGKGEAITARCVALLTSS